MKKSNSFATNLVVDTMVADGEQNYLVFCFVMKNNSNFVIDGKTPAVGEWTVEFVDFQCLMVFSVSKQFNLFQNLNTQIFFQTFNLSDEWGFEADLDH